MRIKNSLGIMPVALALAVGFSMAPFNTAHAGGFTANTGQLPDASNIYRSKLKVQIIDTNPEVTDHRKAQDNTVYQINIPPAPQATTHVVQVGAPADGANNGGAGGNNSVPIMHSGLPFAGSQSNISPHQALANHLPNGTSTGVHATLAKPTTVSAAVVKNNAPMAKLTSAPASTHVASYTPVSPTSSVSQSKSTSTNAYGSLLKSK